MHSKKTIVVFSALLTCLPNSSIALLDSNSVNQATYTVRGFVTDPLGRSRGNVYITPESTNIWDGIRSDLQGQFVLERVRPEQKSWLVYSQASQAMGLFTIPDNYNGGVLRVTLNFNEASVEGRVVKPDGKGAIQRKVELIIRTTEGLTYCSQCYGETDEYGNYESSIPCGLGLSVQARLADANETEKKYVTQALDLPDNQIFVQMPRLVIGEGKPEETNDGKVLYSGRVVNEQGEPISKVKLQLSFRIKRYMSIWIRNVMTDEDGRWKRRIPIGLSDFTIDLLHPEYIKQSWQRVSTDELLKGTNVLVMRRGLPFRGIVKNEQGEPVENALVDTGGGEGWTPYSEVIENCKTPRTIADGSFRVGGLAAERMDIVVSANGYAPRIISIDIREEMEPVEVVLNIGKTYTGQVVDVNGRPIEAVKIDVDEWRIGNLRKSFTRIARTDAQGYLKIENLPDEGKIRLDFGKRNSGLNGFSKEVPEDLSEVDRIVMYRTPVFTGKVIDSETEEPITKFLLTNGIKSSVSEDSIDWSRSKQKVTSEDGTFTKTWSGYWITYPFDGICCLRVEADRYLAETAPPIRLGEKNEPCLIRMTKAEPWKGVVIDNEGKPVAEAEVGWVGPEEKAYINKGKFDRRGFSQQAEYIVQTDSVGRFKLPPSRDNGLIVTIHEKGYASVESRDLKNDSQLQLSPWARIEGTCVASEQDDREFIVSVNPALSAEESQSQRIRWLFDRISYSEKNFTIDYIPAVPLYINRIIESQELNPVYIEPQPGETYKIQLSSEAGTVTGRILVPPSLLNKTLPDLKKFGIDLQSNGADDKVVLVCFFDYQQRPSRNYILQLSKRAQELKAKDVVIIAVQTSMVEKAKLNEWIKENNIPFAVGIIEGDSEKIQLAWGVKSLPWLILTDKNHIVTAEGFGIDELEEKIKAIQ